MTRDCYANRANGWHPSAKSLRKGDKFKFAFEPDSLPKKVFVRMEDNDIYWKWDDSETSIYKFRAYDDTPILLLN